MPTSFQNSRTSQALPAFNIQDITAWPCQGAFTTQRTFQALTRSFQNSRTSQALPASFQNSRPCLTLPMSFQNQGLKCQALTSSFQNSRTSQASLMRFQSSRTCLVLPMGKHSKNFPGLDKLSKFQDLPGLSKELSKSRVSRPNCQGAFQTPAGFPTLSRTARALTCL